MADYHSESFTSPNLSLRMVYNTRKRNISLPSLGVQLPADSRVYHSPLKSQLRSDRARCSRRKGLRHLRKPSLDGSKFELLEEAENDVKQLAKRKKSGAGYVNVFLHRWQNTDVIYSFAALHRLRKTTVCRATQAPPKLLESSNDVFTPVIKDFQCRTPSTLLDNAQENRSSPDLLIDDYYSISSPTSGGSPHAQCSLAQDRSSSPLLEADERSFTESAIAIRSTKLTDYTSIEPDFTQENNRPNAAEVGSRDQDLLFPGDRALSGRRIIITHENFNVEDPEQVTLEELYKVFSGF